MRWDYPSSGSNFNNRYVVWNYVENTWATGSVGRTAGNDRGAFPTALSADRFGVVYEDEVGTDYLDFRGTAIVPYIISGPIQIAQGDNVLNVMQIIPDEITLGDCQMTIYSRLYPTGTELTFGPYSMANPTSTRISGRQIRVKVEQVSPDWRYGAARLDVSLGGLR
jgi:hypothetical protein